MKQKGLIIINHGIKNGLRSFLEGKGSATRGIRALSQRCTALFSTLRGSETPTKQVDRGKDRLQRPAARTDSCRAPRPGMQWSGFLDMRVTFTPAAVGRAPGILGRGKQFIPLCLAFISGLLRLTLKSSRVAPNVVLLTACEPLRLISLSGASGRTEVGIPAPHRGHRLTQGGAGGTCPQGALMQWWQRTGRLVHVRWFFLTSGGAVPLWAVLGGENPQTRLCRPRFSTCPCPGSGILCTVWLRVSE